MKKVLNACLLLSSLIGYLEWGKDNHSFLFQVEYELIFGSSTHETNTFTHPFVLIPLLGQLLLFITLFQKTPNKAMTYTGMISVGILLLFMFLIGIMAMNVKMILFSLPFIVTSILVIRAHRKKTAKA